MAEVPGHGIRRQLPRGGELSREFLLLLDEFERYVAEAPRVPLTGKAMLEEDDLYALIDQLRQSIPGAVTEGLSLLEQEEDILARAQSRHDRILSEVEVRRDKILSDAEAKRNAILREAEQEAEDRIAEARRHAERLIEDSVVLQQVRVEADALLAEAQETSEELREGADRYANEILGGLEEALSRTLQQVRQGRSFLEPHLRRGKGSPGGAQ